MMRKIAIFVVCFLALNSLPSNVFGSVVVTVGDGTAKTFIAGSTVILPIFAKNELTFSVDVTSFELGFDISSNPDGYDGASVPGGTTFFDLGSLAFSSSLFPQDPFASQRPPSGRNYDILITSSSPGSYTFSAGSTIQLGTVSFNVSSSATPGNYGFKFVPNANRNSNLENIFAPFTAFSAGSGPMLNYFEIQEVPEPGSITLLAIGLAGGVTFRNYRRRTSAKSLATADDSSGKAKV